jgi:hypothetical protein
MCGDLEEDDAGKLAEQLYGRFLVHARELLSHQGGLADKPADLNGYMDKLFADALSRAARDAEQANGEQHYQRLVGQSLVFARLAGFLAAHQSLHEDPLRRTIEAMMSGYAEAEEIAEHGHSHAHGHDHHH